jgi:peptidoglycan hydrolase-like protein with peptidoglycan-binding domain
MRRVIVATAVVAVVAAAGAGLALSRQGAAAGSPTSSPAHSATRLVAVARTTLVATQPVSGEVTSSETWAVGLPTGSAPDEVAAAVDAVAAARESLAAARSALAAAARIQALVEARDTAAVADAPAGSARHEAIRQRSLDRIDQAAARTQARTQVAAALRGLAAANREVSAKRTSEAAAGGTVTMLPAIGTTVARGEALYALDGRPVILLVGNTPAYRAIREGDVGPDVAQLQENLVALGFGGTPAIRTDGTFDHATALAVRRWQTAAHLASSEVVRLGDAVVLPAEVRVSATHVAVGGGAQPGTLMLDVASVDEVVKVVVDPGLAPSVHVGDPIRFAAPDGTEIPGSVASVGAPAPSTEDGPSGPAGILEVEVVATADDPAALADLDGLTLTADVTTGTAADALAVPVAALVVLGDGSFGVEIESGGATHFVRVTPGIYDRTMVQVEAGEVTAGDQVVVPGA